MQPISSSERIQVIDILRGFALFGVLIMNLYIFNFPNDGTLFLNESLPVADSITSWFVQIFISGKFYTLFSFLFGLGFSIQIARLKDKDVKVTRIYSRRLLILLGMGLIHSIVIWNGDILKFYAVIGFVLLLFRNSSIRKIKIWMIILFSLFYVGYTIGAIADTIQKKDSDKVENTKSIESEANEAEKPSVDNENGKKDDEKTKNEISYNEYKNGNYLSTIKENINVLLDWKQIAILILGLLYILPIFLLGSLFGRMEIFSNGKYKPFLLKLLFGGLSVGIAMSSAFVYFHMTTSKGDATIQRALLHIAEQYAALPLTLAYISGIVLLYNIKFGKRLLKPLAPVGQMALTNYLSQSIVFTWVFYGQGLGLIGQKSTLLIFLMGVCFFIFQIVFSKWWMKNFSFGPAEWFWRILTYGEVQKFKK